MKREETKSIIETIENSVISMDHVKDSMFKQFKAGKEPGTKTYIEDIDHISVNGFNTKAWSWRPGEMNLWSGYNNEGKSEFIIFLCLLKALNENKKFAFFSPENFPPDDFYDNLIHTLLGKTTDRRNKLFDMSDKEYLDAIERIKDNFYFVYPLDADKRPDFRIEAIEQAFEYLIFEKDIFGVIVDPYIKIRHEMQSGEPEHLYASRFMMDRINWTRRNNVSYNLIMHQLTPKKDKDSKNYPKPSLYNIKGGGTFSDSADNVLTIWRPNRGSDPLDTQVIFFSEKIKKQKLVGIPHEIPMDFSRHKNRYMSPSGKDYMDGSIQEKPEPEIYRPDKFSSSGEEHFNQNNDPAPF